MIKRQLLLLNALLALVLSVLILSIAAPVFALIPEPSNLIYGTVSIDDVAIDKDDTHISLVLFNGNTQIASYQMGSNPNMGDRFLLDVPLDIILARKQNSTRQGDALRIGYRVQGETIVVAEHAVDVRATTRQLSLNLRSEVIDAGLSDNVNDTDGDGIPDDAELLLGLDPYNAQDALADADGDGANNLLEYRNGTDSTRDDYAPVLIAPENKIFNANALFSELDLGRALASDGGSGDLSASASGDGYFAPGTHAVTWQVTDAQGNSSSDTQTVFVHPLVNFSQNKILVKGSTVLVGVHLNGPAVTYPVHIPFTVSATGLRAGNDYYLDDGVIVIEQGLQAELEFSVSADLLELESEQEITISMGEPSNATRGSYTDFTARLRHTNQAPRVSITALQANQVTRVIDRNGGLVQLQANIDDPDALNSPTTVFSSSHESLVDINPNDEMFSFDPALLSDGTYSINIAVQDEHGAEGLASLDIRVQRFFTELSTADIDGDGLSDIDEGFNDDDNDGIENYADALLSKNVIQTQPLDARHYLIEAEPSVHLSLGRVAFERHLASALLTDKNVFEYYGATDNGGDEYNRNGGIVDLIIGNVHDSAFVVLPQLNPVPSSAVFQVFNVIENTWVEFHQDENNRVFSAMGASAYCPPPGDARYRPGLTEGHHCVQLQLESGGRNDAKPEYTTDIALLGGVAGSLTQTETNRSSSGGGGMHFTLWLLMIAIVIYRRLIHTKNRK